MAGPEDQRIRVLMMIETLLPGGAERTAATLAERLDRSRFEPMVCVTRPLQQASPLVDDLERAGIPIVRLSRTSRWAVWAWWPVLELLRRRRIEVLHSHMFGSNVWGSVLATLSRVPVFVAHEQGSTFEGNRLRPFLDRNLVGRAADAVIVVSRMDERTMIDVARVPRRKVRLVMNGIAAPDPAGTDVRAELGIPPEAPVIGTVSVLRPEKGVDVLIDAAELLAAELPDLRVLVAGGGPEEERLRAVVSARGLNETVFLLGLRRDVADVLRALDVLAFSSDREGTPLAVMESMAAGKPIVATRVGGIPDLIEDRVHGLLVPPRDPRALAGALGRLLGDEGLRTRLGANARERQSQEFDIEVTVRNVERIYEELVAAARRHADRGERQGST